MKTAPLAVKDERGRPRLLGPAWPVMVQDGQDGSVSDAVFMVSYANREEKGSDVNAPRGRLGLASTISVALPELGPHDIPCPGARLCVRAAKGPKDP